MPRSDRAVIHTSEANTDASPSLRLHETLTTVVVTADPKPNCCRKETERKDGDEEQREKEPTPVTTASSSPDRGHSTAPSHGRVAARLRAWKMHNEHGYSWPTHRRPLRLWGTAPTRHSSLTGRNAHARRRAAEEAVAAATNPIRVGDGRSARGRVVTLLAHSPFRHVACETRRQVRV